MSNYRPPWPLGLEQAWICLVYILAGYVAASLVIAGLIHLLE